MIQKKILVTGMSRGIGRAIADHFFAQGWYVIGCASSAKSLAELKQTAPAYEAYQVDMADKAQVQRFGKTIIDKHGALDVVVNNAGRFEPGQLHNEADGVLESQLATNLHSAYHLTRAVLPPMLQAARGTIINICSTASITAYTNGGSYCISKFALLGFSKVLRAELKDKGIRVVSILPGATLTDSWAGTDLPPDRFMHANDVAQAAWLACTLPSNTVIEEILLRPQLGDIG